MLNTERSLESINYGLISFVVAALLFMSFEPAIGIGATTASSQFTISQSIGSEISFVSAPANVIMTPTIGGISGGTAFGTTSFSVYTSNTTGYNIKLTASSSLGMIGNASSTNIIPAYVPSNGTTTDPDYNFTVPANKAFFGYTVIASSTADVSPLFYDNGSNRCNTGTDHLNPGHCWLNASTSDVLIINRTVPTSGGAATSSIVFQAKINANPNPMIPNDTYVATTTLTATNN